MRRFGVFCITTSCLFGCGANITDNLPVNKQVIIQESKTLVAPQERKDTISSIADSNNITPTQVKNVVNLNPAQNNVSPSVKTNKPDEVKPKKETTTTQSTQEPIFFDSGSSSYVIPALNITDVIRLDNNQSIVGTNAPASLTYSPETSVKLKITGTNFADSTEPQKWDFYLVEYDPEILIETFIKKPIKKKVILDDIIVLQPDAQGVFTPNELNVIFDSNGVLDASLTGLHSLKVYDGLKMAEVKIKFDKTDKKYNFQPTISNIIVKEDPQQTGKYKSVEVTGTNYFIDYKRNWIQIDSKRAYIHKVKVLKGDMEIKQMKALIHLPPDFIRTEGQNTINFATPYGVVFRMF